MKVGELVASFLGHVGGARKWPENEATAHWEELGSVMEKRLEP